MRSIPPSRPVNMTARLAACLALQASELGEVFAQEALHALLEKEARRLSPADKALATELTLGTMRHRRTVQALLNHQLARGVATTAQLARLAMEVGVYQLIFLQRIPEYAIVDSSVEVARQLHAPGLTGLVNAVLRKVAAMVEARIHAMPPDREGFNLRRSLPLPHGGGIVFKREVFPPEPVPQLGEVFSFPDLLVQRWLERYGIRRSVELMATLNRPPRIIGRVNLLRTTPQEIREVIAAAGGAPPAVVAAGDAAVEAMAAAGELIDLTDVPHDVVTQLLQDGRVTIQDPTTLLPIAAMELEGLQRGRVLDLCAAPGGKTAGIADRLHDRPQVEIVATDRRGERLDLLRATVARLGIERVAVHPVEELPPTPSHDDQRFDRILADVPCSNTGVLRRRAEARWRFSEKELLALTRMQRGLLERAATLIGPGGLIVYSTCSIEPEENEKLVEIFLLNHPEMRLDDAKLTLPEEYHDGGYYCRLMKK